MEETTLLFRHLPSELSDEERKDLLYHLGATHVKVMGRSGSMKNTAFALFPSKDQATKILNQLHQVEFLSSKLVVEFAKKNLPQVLSIIDNEGVKKTEKEDSKDLDKVEIEPQEVKFDTTFNVWGLKHPRRPELRYLYPPPTQSILTNILHALAAVPKFYVQVLHLMNKMDLPAPFGPVTLTPPVRSDVQGYYGPDDVDQRAMDISSDTESELDSGDEINKEIRNEEKQHLKRPPRSAMKPAAKRPKLSDLKDIGADLLPATTPVQVNDVFEQVSSAGPRKIELKLPPTIQPPPLPPPPPLQTLIHPPPSYLAPAVSDYLPHQSQNQISTAIPEPTTIHQQNETHPLPQATSDEVNMSYDVPLPPKESELQAPAVVVGGFGVMEPVHKPVDKTNDEDNTEKEWTKSKFISSKELKKFRLSKSEMSELSVYKRYEEGEPSCRLYIKNLAKNVTEEDIHWVYGRYVDWDNELETTIFDIRLMKTGRMKGQGFVTLPSEKVAVTAVKETNGLLLKDKPLVVQFARSAKAHEEDSSKS
uniref:RNA-binding region-containing protein 3 n=1 Tax=Biomphalaria glabrata TaxID=6526 RepID=A0A2C9LJB6_BIOGL